MRGPLLSGAIGSPATLRLLVELVRGHAPIAVMGPPWLAETLETEGGIWLLTAEGAHPAGLRAVMPARKVSRTKKASKPAAPAAGTATAPAAGLATAPATGGELLTVGPGSLGAVMIESLAPRDLGEAAAFLLQIAAVIRPGGKVLALDRTRDTAVEAQVATAFLAAGFGDITQSRPRSGAVVTAGVVPHPQVRQLLAAGPTV